VGRWLGRRCRDGQGRAGRLACVVMLRSEEARLRGLFQRLLLLSLAVPAGEYACSNGGGNHIGAAPAAEGGDDSSIASADASDATQTADATSDAFDATVSADAPLDTDAPSTDARQTADATPADGGGDAPSCPIDTHGDGYETDASWVTTEAGSEKCFYFVDLPCGADFVTSACKLYLSECAQLCVLDGAAAPFFDCEFTTNCEGTGPDASFTGQPGQPQTVACGLCSGVGRRPSGLARAPAPRAETALGDWFARAAHLESASVVAFEALARELATHDAPRTLLKAATRSARDEVRHARVTTALARRFGAVPRAVRVKTRANRSLEAIARENAVEGCVRETFGAMVATWQATHAKDGAVQRAMEAIARDETRHAALSFAVARWADAQLDACARERIQRAQRRAVARLAREVAFARVDSVADVLGLPSPAEAARLFGEMRRTLWA
jgi:hypothetical protein